MASRNYWDRAGLLKTGRGKAWISAWSMPSMIRVNGSIRDLRRGSGFARGGLGRPERLTDDSLAGSSGEFAADKPARLATASAPSLLDAHESVRLE